jgi:UDP-N-acetylmuramoylalanine--D-glutamate ligase
MNCLVLGAGRSGSAAAKLLLHHGADVTLYDDKPYEKLNHISETLFKEPKLKTCFNKELSLDNFDCAVISPGISYKHTLIEKAKNKNILLLNEIDNAYKFLRPATIIGITGTNGKSTTTTMIEHILRVAKKCVYAGGNLGMPLSEIALKAYTERIDYIVLELSSFQLEHMKNLKLDVAVILNISPDHLDRHINFSSYQNAKLKILDLLKTHAPSIINYDLYNIINKNNTNIDWIYHKNYQEISSLNLAGDHNYENACAAYLVAKKLGIDYYIILDALSTYKNLPHRCELVAIKNNISYINDSKGTTVIAVTKALSMTKNPVHLLLGGCAKGDDFTLLQKSNFPHIKAYYVFGQDKYNILKSLNTPHAFEYTNLEQSFLAAQRNAQAGDVILLSPACASYDQFNNFNERGELFRKLVENI